MAPHHRLQPAAWYQLRFRRGTLGWESADFADLLPLRSVRQWICLKIGKSKDMSVQSFTFLNSLDWLLASDENILRILHDLFWKRHLRYALVGAMVTNKMWRQRLDLIPEYNILVTQFQIQLFSIYHFIGFPAAVICEKCQSGFGVPFHQNESGRWHSLSVKRWKSFSFPNVSRCHRKSFAIHSLRNRGQTKCIRFENLWCFARIIQPQSKQMARIFHRNIFLQKHIFRFTVFESKGCKWKHIFIKMQFYRKNWIKNVLHARSTVAIFLTAVRIECIWTMH